MRIASALLLLCLWSLPRLAFAGAETGGAPRDSSPAASELPVLPPVVVEEPRLEPERRLDNEEALEAIRRTPGGVALVPEASIERTRASSLEDVLISVPGVYVRSRGTGEEPQISIRGSGLRSNFHVRGVNILIDGFPFQNADGFSEVEAFEFLAAKRVEVYKGANSVRFGGNTLGGAINIVTQTGRDAPPVRVRSEAGAFGLFKSYGSAAVEGEGFDAFLAVSHGQQSGFRDHAEQDQQRLYGSIGHALPRGAALRIDGVAVRSRRQLPGALTRAELRDDPSQADPESRSQDAARDFNYARGAITLTIPVSPELRFDWQTNASYQDLDHPLPFGIIDSTTFNLASELRAVLAHALGGRDGRLDAGLQVAWTRQPQRILTNDAGSAGPAFSDTRSQAANIALYASEELALCDRVSLVGGARLQWASRQIHDRLAHDTDQLDSLFVAPSLGAIWRFTDTAELYANVGYAVEPGLLFELAAPGNLAGDLEDLDPQRALQLELGARGTLLDERVGFDVAIFDIELEDEIRNVNVDPTGMGFFTIPRFENIDRSRHAGIEAGLEVLLARDLSALFGRRSGGSLRAETSYTYSRFDYVDDDQFGDNELPGAPRHFLTSTLRFEHPSGVWIAPRIVWVPQRWFVDGANQGSAGAYLLFDLRAGFDHEASGLSLFVEGRNLGDRDHVSAVVVDADDGRAFQPGDGRGVFGGIEWRFR